MTWQKSVARAVRALKVEEARLTRELEQLRQKIASLGGAAAGGGVKARRRTLSPAARAAISRAAKKRWAKYREEKAKA
jgi:hypothetical protein